MASKLNNQDLFRAQDVFRTRERLSMHFPVLLYSPLGLPSYFLKVEPMSQVDLLALRRRHP